MNQAKNNTIDINSSFELRDWADKFGVTVAKVRAAVNAVGSSAQKVEAYLKRNR